MDKALMILRLLVEGNSVRSIERITDVGKKTILNLLELAGRKCEALLDEQIQNVPVKHVIHKTLRVTPAMEAGITNRVWEIRELLGA